jgi:hypothetical protein
VRLLQFKFLLTLVPAGMACVNLASTKTSEAPRGRVSATRVVGAVLAVAVTEQGAGEHPEARGVHARGGSCTYKCLHLDLTNLAQPRNAPTIQGARSASNFDPNVKRIILPTEDDAPAQRAAGGARCRCHPQLRGPDAIRMDGTGSAGGIPGRLCVTCPGSSLAQGIY